MLPRPISFRGNRLICPYCTSPADGASRSCGKTCRAGLSRKHHLSHLCRQQPACRVPKIRNAIPDHIAGEKETGMAKAGVATGLVASCLLLWGPAAPAWAQQAGDSRVAGILNYRPGQEGIVCSTPTAEETK